MPNLTKLIFVALWPILLTLPANAHHSYAQFDQTKCATVEGIVKKWEFTYPHTWLWLTAKGPDASDVLYGFEGNDPASLAVYGWTPELLFKGDKVTVTYSPLRDGRNGGSVRFLVLPNGEKLSADGSTGDSYFEVSCDGSDSDEGKESGEGEVE